MPPRWQDVPPHDGRAIVEFGTFDDTIRLLQHFPTPRSFPLDFSICEISESESRSVISDSSPPHGLYSPWNSPDQNAGVGSFSLLQGIFPTQGLNPGLHALKVDFFTS